jgi:hypothetical protein
MRVHDIFTEDKKADIMRLQSELNRKGATIQVDGVLGPETLLALYKFVPNALPTDIVNRLNKIADKSNISEPTRQRRSSGGKVAAGSAFKDPEFNKKLEQISKRLGVAPDVLRAVIYAESRGNPTARDPYNVSAGLIGFTRDTARSLGTTREEILQMTALDQLDLVYDYFRKVGVKPGMTRGDVYMLTFMPAFVGASDDTVLGKEGGGELVTPGGKSSRLSMHKVWYQNPVFGRSKGRSYFTVGDVKRHVNSLPAPDIDESINEADINPVDTIELDVPLLLRMMEYAREDAKTDMDLHDVTEKMISLSKTGQGLSMKDYESIVGDDENLGEAGNMNIPAMPDITGLQPGQTKMLGNGERVTLGADGKVYLQGGFGVVTYNQQGQALDYKTPTFGGLSSTQNIATGKTTATYNPIKSMNITQPMDTKQEAIGGSSAEEFLKSVEYRPRHQAKPKRTLMGDPVREGHGRYWCSTDKRWKERQGPKQSRS